MTGWFVFVAYIAAVNPPRIRSGLSAPTERGAAPHLVTGAAIVAAVGLLLVIGANGILDMLDISDETWRLASGVICGLAGAGALVAPRLPEMPTMGNQGLVPIAFPLLFTPQLAALAVLFGATESHIVAWGWLATGVAAGVTVGTMRHRQPELWLAGTRFLAAVMVAVGVALIVAGIRDV